MNSQKGVNFKKTGDFLVGFPLKQKETDFGIAFI